MHFLTILLIMLGAVRGQLLNQNYESSEGTPFNVSKIDQAICAERLESPDFRAGHEIKPGKKEARFADIADPMGPWFDGVASFDQDELDEESVNKIKSKTFGIVGAGISGLFTAFLLESVGIHNWKIIEASDRIGGRIRTIYLNGSSPGDYQYQEAGAMRLPHSILETETGDPLLIQDTQMIYQLADALNSQNGHDPDLLVNFIPWIESTGMNEEATNEHVDESTAVTRAKNALSRKKGLNMTRIREFAGNIFKAHKKAVRTGHFNYSPFTYLTNVYGARPDVADQVATSANDWPLWETEDVYLMANEWRTIDKGMQRLTDAFIPLVMNRTLLRTKVTGVRYRYNEDRDRDNLTLFYRPTASDPLLPRQTVEVDHLFNSVPFSILRFWDLPPHSSRLRHAIDRMVYSGSVKLILLFKTRFWEQSQRPIYGGCVKPDIPGSGEICYPSYYLNGSGPGVILSYIGSDDARAICAMSEEEHVAILLDALGQVHGSTVLSQYTGVYHRHCWDHEEHSGGAWSAPIGPQQPLYLPAYWRTEFNTVYIGEHASYTHSYVFSAMESAVRGTVQMLLDIGLVKEAKTINRVWMGRWISVDNP